ncbi:MAG: amidase, partial [Chloroflexi bacterium]|nr:amidase [Chloroflexota bacterium]
MSDSDLCYLTIGELARLIESKAISPVEVTAQQLARIETLDGRLKSYATVMADRAMAAAKAAEGEIAQGRYRGPLHGTPVAVKDLCYTRGVRTMGGSRAFADHVPTFDATVVARLQTAGAILLGKLNLTEGAMAGYHPDFDIPVNPWRSDVSSGVSSSGSGVAVAAGLCFGALGSDTGGSIRFPSAACGVVGLKPTWGRVSRYGVLPLAESLDHVGPMARSVADVAIVLQAIAGLDPNDPTSLPDPAPNILS